MGHAPSLGLWMGSSSDLGGNRLVVFTSYGAHHPFRKGRPGMRDTKLLRRAVVWTQTFAPIRQGGKTAPGAVTALRGADPSTVRQSSPHRSARGIAPANSTRGNAPQASTRATPVQIPSGSHERRNLSYNGWRRRGGCVARAVGNAHGSRSPSDRTRSRRVRREAPYTGSRMRMRVKAVLT